jgi:hypothetical protein
MKKNLIIGMLFVIAVLALVGCSSLGAGSSRSEISSTNDGNFGEHVNTPVKDFESLGLVFTETQLITSDSDSDSDSEIDAIEGKMFTYQALLKEAQALGADAIINVVIDNTIQTNTVSKLDSSTGSTRITTWYGSALAIQYTETLTESETVIITNGDNTTTTTTSSVYFNGDTAPKSSSSIGSGPSEAPAGLLGGLLAPAAAPAPAATRGLRQ